MPQKHSSKDKRQAKHIIAGYKKRGVPLKTAKSIAWATVTKQQNESWMFNGAGEPVFMGNQGNVSQFDPSGQVSPGQSYIPDEVAKMLVKESGLRKLDTISKKVIEGYLESMRLSRGLAVDVARVLRDVYGITPTFDEATLYARSGALIEELTHAVNESFPMPFAVDDEPDVLTEADIVGSFIQSEFMESTDEGYDLVLANMAMLPLEELCDVVDFHEWVGTEVFNYIESIAVNGPEGAAEKVVEGLCWPHRIQFMPEHIQELFEDKFDDLHAVAKHHEKWGGGGDTAKKLAAIARQRNKPVSDKKQMKKLAKDRLSGQGGDQLADRAKQHADSERGTDQKMGALHTDPKLGDRLLARKKKEDPSAKAWAGGAPKPAHGSSSGLGRLHDVETDIKKRSNASEPGKHADAPVSEPSRSRMKRAGGAAIDLMKKVHTPSKFNPEVGTHLKRAAVGAGKLAVAGAGHAVGAAGHVIGKGIAGLARGMFGKKKSEPTAAGKSSSGDTSSGEKKPGLFGKIAGAAGRFVRNVVHHAKEGYKNATPGIQSQKGGDQAEPEAKKEKQQRVANSGVGAAESVFRSGSLLNEIDAAFNGRQLDEGQEEPRLTPADVVGELDATAIVDIAVLEAIGEMDWRSVADLAGFMMLVPERLLGLIQSFNESTDAFRVEWRDLEESGTKPSWMNVGSFVKLAKLSTDEGVVPRLVYWAGKTLQHADEGVVAYVAESYPELGKTVYGPAGDPNEGPRLAKSFMTPHPTGTMTPANSDCTTRMFSDPDDRDRARKSKLADVMAALDGMRSQADAAGVPPEGMFLNLYRDLHREKVRYS